MTIVETSHHHYMNEFNMAIDLCWRAHTLTDNHYLKYRHECLTYGRLHPKVEVGVWPGIPLHWSHGNWKLKNSSFAINAGITGSSLSIGLTKADPFDYLRESCNERFIQTYGYGCSTLLNFLM
jgi:hypothetical protein